MTYSAYIKDRGYWQRVGTYTSFYEAVTEAIYLHPRKRLLKVSLTNVWRTKHLPARETWDAFNEFPASMPSYQKKKLKRAIEKIKLDRQLESKYKQSEAKKLNRKNGLEEKGIIL